MPFGSIEPFYCSCESFRYARFHTNSFNEKTENEEDIFSVWIEVKSKLVQRLSLTKKLASSVKFL